jgi:hypothetical protein
MLHCPQAPVTFLSPRHPSAGGMLPNTPRQAAAHGGGGSGGGREPAPLTLADAAVNLGREKAANAEITPLEVDPSLGFDQVGGSGCWAVASYWPQAGCCRA